MKRPRMASSLRRRLQVWYGLVLSGLILVFGVLLFGRVREMRLSSVDVELIAVADYLDANLRSFPPHELNPEFTPLDDAPWPPPHRDMTRLMANLDFPEMSGHGAVAPSSVRDEWYFAVVRPDGSLLKASPHAPALEALPRVPLAPKARPKLVQSGEVREATMTGPQNASILVAKTMRAELAELRRFGLQLFGLGLAILAVGLAGGWWISGRIVRPIHQISELAESVSEKNLSQRIDVEEIDEELVGLANALNTTFDRLEKAFAQQVQLTADASHELRTPLSVLRTQAELALSKTRTPEEYRNALTGCLDAARKMTKLVDGMLTLARADAGQMSHKRDGLSFDALVQTAVEELRPLAISKGVTLNLSVKPVSVRGDATNLARVVTNLVSNAIYYNRPQGRIDVDVRSEAEFVRLTVRDTGKGIPEASRDLLFHRFFRADKSRARTSGGHGLGLAITKAIVESHGGHIEFTSDEDRGTIFRVTLPRGDQSPIP